MAVRMIVGLGNPGRRYSATRHNVGFMVAEELLGRCRRGADRMQEAALVGPVRFGSREAIVVRPQTYMNESGPAVAAVARRHGIAPGEVLLVYDDADLPLGTLRVRAGGSPAGHRGVTSIVAALGTTAIPRIRIGIGKGEEGLTDRVLAAFTRPERPVVRRMIEQAADAAELAAASGLAAAMNRYNRREASPG